MQNIEFGVVTQKTIINVEEGYPLKAFAPVDENGEIANNGDAYGIVIDALGIGEVKQLVVMTAGCIDKICAEQHYGESYSTEAISALENIVIFDNHKIGGGGGGWPADLPKPSVGGYGYTEQGNQTVITWDGDTEGRESFGIEQITLYLVSNTFATIDDLDGATITFQGSTSKITRNAIIPFEDNLVYVIGDGLIISAKAGTYDGFVVPTDGIYFAIRGGLYVTSLIYGGDTVHKIDEKYLPSGGTMVVNISIGDDGSHVADKTPQEIVSAFNSGTFVYAVLRESNQTATLTVADGYSESAYDVQFDSVGLVPEEGVIIAHIEWSYDDSAWIYSQETIPLN